jgi:Zn finger protein HypA/HybF involved in hydrogenase expression
MENIFKKVIDILIAVIIMFFFPLLYFSQRQDTITQNVVRARTTELVDTVRTRGFITKDMYSTYLESLEHAHLLGDLDLEHKELILEPEYRFKTADEVREEQDAAWGGQNIYHYIPVTTEVPYVADEIDTSGVSADTNATVIANTPSSPASPTHVHTDSCYSGHRHIGSPTEYGGCYTATAYHSHSSGCYSYYNYTHTHNSSCYYTSTSTCGGSYSWSISTITPHVHSIMEDGCKGMISGQKATGKCNKCGATITYAYYQSCSVCDFYIGDWRPSSCSKTTTSTNLICGMVEGQTYTGSTLVCGKTTSTVEGYKASCGLTEDTTIDCGTIIESITPTHSIQKVYIDNPFITVVIVTYRNGSSSPKIAAPNFTPNQLVQNKLVTLTYSGKTTTITVTVIPKTKTCINGHTYHLKNDGSDPGCPYCNSWLRSISVISPTSGEITIYKGTTLESNGVAVLAVYLNGRTETLYSGYANNLDSNFVGSQTVTISYKGKYTSLKVNTKRNLVECSQCRRFYELLPDDTDPGCPYCAALIPVFTGNVMKYYTKYSTEDILKDLYEGSGIYYFKRGDFFQIDIKNRNKTMGTRFLNAFLPVVNDISIQVKYGGAIRDEVNRKEGIYD